MNFRHWRRLAAPAAIMAALSLAACGGGQRGGGPDTSAGTYKVGKPYTIGGQTYTPAEDSSYRQTGKASWYGPGFHGKRTANGEVYDQYAHTAAHRTLPMPSVVRVTNTDNGQVTVVRVNDRGPFAHNRIIDLSRIAAADIDMIGAGVGNVRVELMERESRAVREIAERGGSIAEQTAVLRGVAPSGPVVAAAPAPVASPVPQRAPVPLPQAAPPATAKPDTAQRGGYFVQAGAFGSVDNAERLRAALATFGDSGVTQTTTGGQTLYRVRLGPYVSADAAQGTAGRIQQGGYKDVRIVSD